MRYKLGAFDEYGDDFNMLKKSLTKERSQSCNEFWLFSISNF